MPDFVQIGLPSSTASSLEIGSTLVPDQVDWGTDLLNQSYVQTLQAQGGLLAAELAPNRKITLPFIFKGSTTDAANQYISALQAVTVPGNIIDVRPENASWITRFDIEGGRVLAHRDIRYHRQGIIQGTLELSTRPWGYTPTWMIAASVTSQKPWAPFAASVIGDIPAYSRWGLYFTSAAGAQTTIGGLVIGQHQMPSYRTVWGAQTGGVTVASNGPENIGGTPSTPFFSYAAWATSGGVGQDMRFAQMNVSDPEIQNLASSTRAFVSAAFSAASVAGGFGVQLTNGGRLISRPAYMIKHLTAAGVSAPISNSYWDLGEISKTTLVTPDGVATALRLGLHPVSDTTVASISGNPMSVDALILVPNYGIMSIANSLDVNGSPGDIWGGPLAGQASRQVMLDTKLQRLWRQVPNGSALSNELTSGVRGNWPLILPVGPSGPAGMVVGPVGNDPELTGVPYMQASTLMQIQITYQPRWTLFR